MNTPRLTRRQLLKYAGATLLGYVILGPDSTDAAFRVLPEVIPSDTPLASNLEDMLAGVVERIQPPKTLYIGTKKGPALVRLSDDTTFSHGYSGRVPGLIAFVPRDEVVVEGRWVNSAFAATTLMSMYRLAEGRIVDRQGNQLKMTGGVIQLIPKTEAEPSYGGVSKPLVELRTGDEIIALIWVDPSTREQLALRISVKP